MGKDKNELVHLKEFQAVLKDYRVQALNRPILDKIELVLLTAATSAGRNTIIHELVKTKAYHFIVSDTTRQPRVNDGKKEKNGREYWFRSEAEVLADLRDGNYLEAAIIHNQQVSGISLRELEHAKDEGKIAITDIEIVGVDNIVSAKPDTLALFVLPPSFEQWQARLKHRGRMTAIERRRRMESACLEFAAALEHKYFKFVINDTIDHALEQVHELAVLHIVDQLNQRIGQRLVEKLYLETQTWLAKH
jgi:guanylate kinase